MSVDKEFRALRRKLARWRESDWRAALRADRPCDRYAIWCAERVGVRLPYGDRWGRVHREFKITYEQIPDCVDDVAIFYTGSAPGWQWQTSIVRGRRDRVKREQVWRDHYEGEIARVIIPAARWEPGPVEVSGEQCPT